MDPASYPHLRAFLGSWLHQDFDLEGDTLEDVVKAYCRVARPDEKRTLRADINEFLQEQGDIEDRLNAEFELDIIPSAFAADGADFLRTIYRLLDSS